VPGANLNSVRPQIRDTGGAPVAARLGSRGQRLRLPSRPVDLDYDLSGRLSFAVRGAGADADRAVRRHMDPFQPHPASADAADVIVDFAPERRPLVELQHPARDGIVTGSDGERLAFVADGRACTLPDPLAERPARFVADPGFALGPVFRTLVRPAIQLALAARGACAVHATAVEVDAGAVLVAGWSESGKTETALALMEDGARFLSDKWTVLGDDREASAFPVGVGVRRWVLPALPRLQAALPRAARAQLAVAGAVERVTRPVRRGAAGGALLQTARRAIERGVALADRAALSPSELRDAYGQTDDPARRVPVRLVAVLETTPDNDLWAGDADPAEAAMRLARSAAYERRDWFALTERAGYAFPQRPIDAMVRSVEHERRLLETALGGVKVVRLRAPFPTDPRAVAAQLSKWL
jgi:hypothetical protein